MFHAPRALKLRQKPLREMFLALVGPVMYAKRYCWLQITDWPSADCHVPMHVLWPGLK